jgi:predicted Rossmann-fold nucleotide-binding protein
MQLSGGYSGSSESLSFGASRVPNSAVEGVTCPAAFPSRVDHQYLNATTPATDLIDRARTLIHRADAFVVMPGGLGTLAKLVLTWNVAAVEAHAERAPLTILAWRQPWEGVITALGVALAIPQTMRDAIKYVESVDQIVAELEQMKAIANKGTAAGSSSSTAPK